MWWWWSESCGCVGIDGGGVGVNGVHGCDNGWPSTFIMILGSKQRAVADRG